MEELPITLDDGERWLPSDIFPPDDHRPLHRSRPFAPSSSSLDDLSRQFGGFGFVDRPPKLPPFREQSRAFGPMEQYAITPPSPNGHYGLTMSGPADQGPLNFAQTGLGFPTLSGESVRRNMQRSVQPRVKDTRATRSARPVHGQLTRPLNRPSTFQPNGLRPPGASEPCGSTSGTGVFIPRATVPAVRPPKCRRDQSAGVSSQRMTPNTFVVRKAGKYNHHRQITSQESLPKDWTY